VTNLENQNDPVLLSENGEEYVSTQVEEVQGRDGDDTIIGALSSVEPGSTLFGNAGEDYIRSRGIADRVFGGRGDDTLVNENGQALIYGDLGSDYLFARETRATLFGGRSFGEATADEGENTLVSNGGENILVGGGGDDYLLGIVGEDTMAGGDGKDSVLGGPNGASYLFGNQGEDYILSTSTEDPDTMFGGQDNDQLMVDASSTADNPLLFGGVGNDSLSVLGSDGNVDGAILVGDVNPDGTFGGSDGDEGNNYLRVDSGKNHQLFGNAGGDTLSLGIDIGVGVSLFGGRGDDLLTGGTDSSTDITAFGDRGDDTLEFSGSDSEFWGDNPNLTTDFGDNVIKVTGAGNVLRGGNDNATGTDSGNNLIQAIAVNLEDRGSTNNTLIGGAGDDTLDAGSSGAGDVLIGGPNGGAGNNTYIFGNKQTIELDTLGLNTYIGVNALETTVTVRGNDQIGGESNFVVSGDNSGVHQIEAGGVKTGAGNDFISIDEATGQTDSGEGKDTLNLGNVGGTDAEAIANTVSGGASDDIININGTDGVRDNALVDGGAGDDTIKAAEGSIFGKVLGGDGDDYIQAKFLKKSEVEGAGLIEGGAGDDTVRVDTMSGGAKINGGEGNDSISVGVALAGATLEAGPGGENSIILDDVGTDADAESSVINIVGGAGKDVLGLGSSASYPSGTDAVRFDIQGGGGNDIIQGGRFRDTLNGGADDDVIYGGSPTLTSNKLNGGLDFTAAGTTQLKTILASTSDVSFNDFGDGDQITAGAGADTIVFRNLRETGDLQRTIFEGGTATATVGTTGGAAGIQFGSSESLSSTVNQYLIGTNGAPFEGGNTLGSTGAAFSYISAGFNVDTVTGFDVSDDVIFLDQDNFPEFAGSIRVFNGRGALFGRIVEGSGASATDFTDPASVLADDNTGGSVGFYESFALTGGTQAGSNIDFSKVGSVYFDNETGGLYVGDGSGASLITVLENVTLTDNQPVADILARGGIGDFGVTGVSLF